MSSVTEYDAEDNERNDQKIEAALTEQLKNVRQAVVDLKTAPLDELVRATRRLSDDKATLRAIEIKVIKRDGDPIVDVPETVTKKNYVLMDLAYPKLPKRDHLDPDLNRLEQELYEESQLLWKAQIAEMMKLEEVYQEIEKVNYEIKKLNEQLETLPAPQPKKKQKRSNYT